MSNLLHNAMKFTASGEILSLIHISIQTNPAQAAEEAEHLIKGKNKKNVELLVAIGNAYLDADKPVSYTHLNPLAERLRFPDQR